MGRQETRSTAAACAATIVGRAGAICVRALNGPLKTAAGWGHCAEPNWARAWHADVASTVWRLTGQVPELPLLVPGGAHVRNDCVYFLTGRAAEWKAREEQEARALIAQQKPDGSYRYDGPYRCGHFEDTANGVCARPAALAGICPSDR